MAKDWTGNLHSVYGCLGTHNGNTKDREENDYYATEPKATELLLNLEELNLNILEPACGEGHISKVLLDHGFNVTSTDLIDRGFGGGGYWFSKKNWKVRWGYNNQPTIQIRTRIRRTRAWVSVKRSQSNNVPKSAIFRRD